MASRGKGRRRREAISLRASKGLLKRGKVCSILQHSMSLLMDEMEPVRLCSCMRWHAVSMHAPFGVQYRAFIACAQSGMANTLPPPPNAKDGEQLVPRSLKTIMALRNKQSGTGLQTLKQPQDDRLFGRVACGTACNEKQTCMRCGRQLA